MRSLLVIAMLSTAPVQLFAQHTGFWHQSTPKGESHDCWLVENQPDMVDALRRFGWNVDAGVPLINWAQDSAIIIAPHEFQNGTQMSFYGIFWREDHFQLEWKRTPIGESVSSGGNSTTFGSVGEGSPETIVVSFPRSMHTNNRFVCTQLN